MAWSQNDLRGDDVLVDASFGLAVNAPPFATTWCSGNSWISYEVWTVGLAKATTLLITDGQVTVSSWTGPTRMAAADRFFVFTLNLTSAYWPLVPGINTVLVPRSVFLDTRLKADFDAGNFAPLPNAAVYGDDLAKAVLSDGVAAVIAGTLDGGQAVDVLVRLLENAAGVQAHAYVDITTTALAANLPTDVVRIVPWASVTSGPTGALPADFLQKIGAAATTVVNALVYVGQLIYKGLVALGTVVDAAVSVAQKVGEGLAKLTDWILDFVRQTLQAAINVLLKPILDLVNAWASASAAQFMALGVALRQGGTTADGKSVVDALMYGALPELVFSLSTLFLGAMIVVGLAAALTPVGAIVAVAKEVLKGIIETAIEHWIATTVAVSAIVGWVLSNVAGGLELGSEILGVAGIIWGAFMVAYAVRARASVWRDAVGLGIAIIGTLVATSVLPLVQLVGSRVLVAIIGTAMSATGLVLALTGPDIAPGLIGNVDEFIDAASLGFDLAKTETTIAGCLSGGVC